MIIFGAVDFTSALVKVAKTLNYHVTVCDAREAFATAARFPDADHVVVDWPDRYRRALSPPLGPLDAVCVLTHDQKFDVPALTEALRTQAGYIGAMGSHRTNAERRKRLISSGVNVDQLERIVAPIAVSSGPAAPRKRRSPSAPRSSRFVPAHQSRPCVIQRDPYTESTPSVTRAHSNADFLSSRTRRGDLRTLAVALHTLRQTPST